MSRRRLGLAAVLVLGLLGPLAPSTPVAPATPAAAAGGRTFGDDPLDDVLHWAGQERRCGLTTNRLAAMMLAPTYPETGAPLGRSPSPMTLSRWDDQPGLHSFGTVRDQPRAFWHPGVGLWQFDSSGLGASLSAAQSIDTFVVSARTAATMAARWCTQRSLAYVWAPWFGCGTSTCRDIYTAIYRPRTDRLVGVARDGSVASRGGMVRRRCTGLARDGEFTCWRVDPARAQGFAAFAAEGYGPAPITAPFYVYASGGREYRHWLRADTGYRRGVWASRPFGANARTSLTWRRGDGLVDVTPRSGGGGPALVGPSGFADVAEGAWYLDALTWATDGDLVAGYDDQTFRPEEPVTRAQAVVWLWSLAGRPEGAAPPPAFTDVGAGAWFLDALAWAAGDGVVRGFADGSFRPGAPVTRAQLASMLWNLADRPVADGPPSFTDTPGAAWYGAAVAWVAQLGYAGGFPDGSFRPDDAVNRAQGVSWLHAARPFDDVAASSWAAPAVDWGRFRQVLAGYDDHTFRGDQPADRATTVTMLWQVMDAPAAATPHGFSDVAAGEPAVSWAASTGTVNGFGDGTFRPTDAVNRAQAVMMAWKVAGRPAASGPPPFSDVGPGSWFAEALSWAAAHGIVDGYPDGTFRATEPVSRAQLAVLLATLAHAEAAWAPGTPVPTTVVFS